MTKRTIYVTIVVLTMASVLASGCAGAGRATSTPFSPLPTALESSPPTPTPLQSPIIPSDTGVPRTPPSASTIPWPEAQELILNGDVWQVAQTHDREVTLYLIDGREIETIEPQLDDVFEVIERCGEPCAQIQRITE